MEGYEPPTYGDRVAGRYDTWYPKADEGAADFLAELAGSGPVLELAVGSGRLALPLVERGLAVHGIDASEAMVEKLRARPGGDKVEVTIGDFADVAVQGRFPLVFVAFNTFFALLTQEDQVRCFSNVAEHLTDDGAFVLEAFVPDLSRFDRGQRVQTPDVELDRVWLELSIHDGANQRIATQIVEMGEGGIGLYPVHVRYAWPSELDLMAQLAGLRLRDRWADWVKSPFGSDSEKHVSVYVRN